MTLVTVSALTPTICEQLVGSPTVGTLKLTHLPPPLLFGRHLWSHYEGFYEFCMVGYIVFRLELPKSQKVQASARQSGRAAMWNIEDIIAANLLHSAFKLSSTTILPSHFLLLLAIGHNGFLLHSAGKSLSKAPVPPPLQILPSTPLLKNSLNIITSPLCHPLRSACRAYSHAIDPCRRTLRPPHRCR